MAQKQISMKENCEYAFIVACKTVHSYTVVCDSSQSDGSCMWFFVV